MTNQSNRKACPGAYRVTGPIHFSRRTPGEENGVDLTVPPCAGINPLFTCPVARNAGFSDAIRINRTLTPNHTNSCEYIPVYCAINGFRYCPDARHGCKNLIRRNRITGFNIAPAENAPISLTVDNCLYHPTGCRYH